MYVSLAFYCIVICYIFVSCTLYVGLIICAHEQYIKLSRWQQETLHGCVHITLFNFQGIQFVQQIYSNYSVLLV